jgi:hypothetical protein
MASSFMCACVRASSWSDQLTVTLPNCQIKKARAHLTAGANRLHGGSKSYNCMRPQEVAALKHLGIRDIVSGNDHLIAIDCVGRLWTWGRGESGQLGRGEFQHSGVPKVVNSFQSQSADTKMKTKIKQVEGERAIDPQTGREICRVMQSDKEADRQP